MNTIDSNNLDHSKNLNPHDFSEVLAKKIKTYGNSLGFQQIGITNIDLSQAEKHLKTWLKQNFHGEMSYMDRHGEKRSRPETLIPGTIRVITARIDYHPPAHSNLTAEEILNNPELASISRYAQGRDYHKLIRKRLAKLAQMIQKEIDIIEIMDTNISKKQDNKKEEDKQTDKEENNSPFHFRAFTDSAPVMEKPLAEKSGLGWIGKNTMLINSKAGSWFFLGTIYTDLPLPIDKPATNHCGSCHACIDVCPTKAIIAPYQLDASRCISYLTIELRTAIPKDLRPLIGNRIYGCDDCQLCCPWNKFAKTTTETAFHPREDLKTPKLLELFEWNEETFLKKTEGSPIRRIGHACWLRNISIALGNAPPSSKIIAALQAKLNHPSELVREHVEWALQHQNSAPLQRDTFVL